MEFFERPRPPGGRERMEILLGDVALRLEGLGEELRQRLDVRYGAFGGPVPAGVSSVVVVVRDEVDRDYYIDPPARAEFNPVILAVDGARVRYLGYRAAGWFDLEQGRGELLLARGTYEPVERAAENYIRASIAWLAATRGGALVHAASGVYRGRGYLFYGESGAGKSTLAACNRRARIVSDDLSLVLPGSDGRPQLVGSPFRGTYEAGERVLGRFPLAAGFRLIQAAAAEVRPVARIRALSELIGNLPFVAEAFGERPDLWDGVERTFREVPLAHLHFRKDDSYWDAIEQAGL
jgi:hypothetical protein